MDGECESCRQGKRINALQTRIAKLERVILTTAAQLDPDCPDPDAYVDGHVSLAESAQAVIRERDEAKTRIVELEEVIEIRKQWHEWDVDHAKKGGA
jgi:hypothetical protein